MHIGPIPIRIIDILDILIVAFIIHQLYQLIKGSFAIYIFYTILALYVLWILIKDNFILLGSFFSQIVSVGVLALIVVFQPELRKFLIVIGAKYFSNIPVSFNQFFDRMSEKKIKISIDIIAKTCISLSQKKIGALIVIQRKSPLDDIIKTGEEIYGKVTEKLIESIFIKNSPLHDGAVIISSDKILAARCILPLTSSTELPDNYGLRHRAALGLSQETDAFIIVISEETGKISVAEFGKINEIDPKMLYSTLEKEFANDL